MKDINVHFETDSIATFCFDVMYVHHTDDIFLKWKVLCITVCTKNRCKYYIIN